MVLAVGITHPEIVADWRKALTLERMDGSGTTYLLDAEEYWWPESPYRLSEIEAREAAAGPGWGGWLRAGARRLFASGDEL